MRQWFINALLFTLVISIGMSLFFMKQRVVEYEKELKSLTNTILSDLHEIHTLKADWAVLTEPSRLRHLLSQSDVMQIDVKQVISPDEVELTPVPVPPQKPFEEESVNTTQNESEPTHDIS